MSLRCTRVRTDLDGFTCARHGLVYVAYGVYGYLWWAYGYLWCVYSLASGGDVRVERPVTAVSGRRHRLRVAGPFLSVSRRHDLARGTREDAFLPSSLRTHAHQTDGYWAKRTILTPGCHHCWPDFWAAMNNMVGCKLMRAHLPDLNRSQWESPGIPWCIPDAKSSSTVSSAPTYSLYFRMWRQKKQRAWRH